MKLLTRRRRSIKTKVELIFVSILQDFHVIISSLFSNLKLCKTFLQIVQLSGLLTNFAKHKENLFKVKTGERLVYVVVCCIKTNLLFKVNSASFV